MAVVATKRRSIEDEIEAAIENFMGVPQVLRVIIARANNDLYYGPTYLSKHGEPMSCFEPYHHQFNFTKACKVIGNWFDRQDLPSFYDIQSGEVLTSEPEGYEDEETGEWIEPFWEDYTALSRETVKKALFGTELAHYI